MEGEVGVVEAHLGEVGEHQEDVVDRGDEDSRSKAVGWFMAEDREFARRWKIREGAGAKWDIPNPPVKSLLNAYSRQCIIM